MDRTDVVLMDGASGTCLWEKAGDRSPVWRYNIENPKIVSELAAEYVDAGSMIVMTNTFSANRPSLKKTNYSVREIVSAGVGLARDAVGGRARVALDVGPLPVFMEPYGDLTEEEAFEIFDEQIRAGIPEKPDLIMLETFMDADMLRVAAEAAARHDLPIFAAMTFTEVGKTIMGHSVERFVETMEGLPIAAVGLTPEEAREKGLQADSRKYPMSANGKSLLSGQERGFIKVVYEKDSRRLLGAHLMCARASDLISEMTQALTRSATLDDLKRVIRPHPTFSEGITEAVTAD